MPIAVNNANGGAASPLRAGFAPAGGSRWVPTQTVRWVTIAKAIAILLMVYCHVWRGVLNAVPMAPTSPLVRGANAVDAIVYAFHMPLFFFLSGMFVERSLAKSTRAFFVRKFNTIVYPYVVWSILQCLVSSVAPSANRSMPLDALRGLLTRPYMQFWFLYVLVLCMLSYWAMHVIKLGAKAFFATTVLAYSAGPLLHLSGQGRVFAALADWGPLYQYRSYAIYFALGAVAGPWALRWAGVVRGRTLAVLMIGGIGAVAGLVLPVQSEQSEYALASAAAVFGMAAVVAASIALAQRRRPWLEAVGEATLPIFAAHVIFAAAVRTLIHRGLHVENLAVHLVAGTAVGVVCPMALRRLAMRTGVPLFGLGRSKSAKQKPAPETALQAPELKGEASMAASNLA